MNKSIEEMAKIVSKTKATPILSSFEKDGIFGTFWHGSGIRLDPIIVATLITNIIENFIDMVPENKQIETEEATYIAINKLKDYKHLDTSDSPI